MTARIFLKLISAVLLIMVVALTAVDYLASGIAERTYIDGLTRAMDEKTRMLGVLSRDRLLTLTPDQVKTLAAAAAGRITIVAPGGAVLLDSENDPARMENHGHRPEIESALGGRPGKSIRRSPTMGINYLYVASPIPAGAIRLAMPLQEVNSQVSAIRSRLLAYTALAFLPAILLAAFFARYFSRRLGAIIDYAHTLATGRFDATLNVRGNDELGSLARQLNETGGNLRRIVEDFEREHAELEKLERVRRDFVVNVSHELRTPLASIQGYTETLIDGAISDANNNIRFLHIIRQNAERLGRLTADLLTLSRLELNTQPLEPASYPIHALLAEAIDSFCPVAARKGLSLVISPSSAASPVFCDSEAVHQMISNLIDNAVKYTPENGSITLETALSGDQLRVSVTDTGPGILPEELSRLFERFYRVDKGRSRELGGTGLGLAIVKHLARAQGGDVGVHSTPGQGSTFWFTLPIHPPRGDTEADGRASS
ncbi:MAG: HAMP domain-containing protein [Candidatus Solibacter usitatus]|nr:HAMP domain-containing protein [Candidatus Solibacter usitatus]